MVPLSWLIILNGQLEIFTEVLHLQVADTEDEHLDVDAGSSGEHPQFWLHCIIDIATYNSLDKLIGATCTLFTM